MISNKQDQKMLQKLTPQQLLLMRLLHLPVMSLENIIKEEIILEKMDQNEAKYPVEKARGNSKKYDEF